MTTKFISHRGNLIGPYPDLENRPEYILNAINSGVDCECDAWLTPSDGKWWLGHDRPQYQVSLDFFIENAEHLWVHAKNLPALEALVDEDVRCFYHDKDAYTLTSHGHIWAYPGARITENTVCVMPETMGPIVYTDEERARAYGICSDYIILEKLKQVRRNT